MEQVKTNATDPNSFVHIEVPALVFKNMFVWASVSVANSWEIKKYKGLHMSEPNDE